MVKLLPVVVATLAAITPVVQAGACTPGLNYCGHTLEENGWHGWGLDGWQLYRCESENNITPVEYCSNGCHDQGAGRSDTCTGII
ncbi:hypothetical protein E4U13_006140 [Claviceps humidiphila]|uniref:Uncharacterized protein n=1 Tax=Claviceps humidiphila TaxID=1294629 RepID=A0A9P7TVU5_9HYPO|nr:hypothetical protein E4U13_006140 [Claviceps humidiphila]